METIEEYVYPPDGVIRMAIPNVYPPDGIIRMAIPNVSKLNGRLFSSYRQVGKHNWRLIAKSECSDRTDFVRQFGVFLHCNIVDEWIVEAEYEFRLVPQKIPNEFGLYTSGKSVDKFTKYSNCWGNHSFVRWSDLVKKDHGYIKDGCIVVDARIRVINRYR